MAKSVASDVRFTLGLISFSADLIPLAENPTKDVSFKMICPDCQDPTRPEQFYRCPAGHDHKPGDLDRARELGSGKNSTLVRVTEDDIKSVKEPTLPQKEMAISVFNAIEVDEVTRPSGAAYRLRADKAKETVALIADLIADGKYAFIGEVNLGRSGQKLYRLSTWRGELVLEELARPEQVVPFTAEKTQYNPNLLDMARMFADKQVEPFDPTAFANKVRERALALDAALSSGAPVPASQPTPAATGTDDLLALLEASIKAAS